MPDGCRSEAADAIHRLRRLAWSTPSARHQREDTARTAGAIDDLEGRRDQHGSRRWQKIEIGEARQAKLVRSMHAAVAREGRVELEGLPGIGADPFGAPADDVALLGEKRHELRMRTRHMRA